MKGSGQNAAAAVVYFDLGACSLDGFAEDGGVVEELAETAPGQPGEY